MTHIDNWLDKYLDGELGASQNAQLNEHLSECPRCQGLLAQRRSLSMLLQEAPPAAGLKPEGQFLAEVNRQVRADQAGIKFGQLLRLGWQLAPVALLLVWIFLQTISILSNVLSFIPGVGQILKADMTPAVQLPGFIESGLATLGLDWLSLIGLDNLLAWNGITNLIILVCIGLLYLGWLASWWARSQYRQVFTS